MELLNHLISMAAPGKYRRAVLWLDMHENIYKLLYTKGGGYTHVSERCTEQEANDKGH